MAPTARIVTNNVPRFGVPDLEEAKEWYSRVFEASVVVEDDSHRSICIVIGDEGAELWLEQLPADKFTGPIKSAARPYYLIRSKDQFLEARTTLMEKGLHVSAIAGHMEGLALFHCFDPYGNQINIWSS